MDCFRDVRLEDDVQPGIVAMYVLREFDRRQRNMRRVQLWHEQYIARRLDPVQREERRGRCRFVVWDDTLGEGRDIENLAAARGGRERSRAPLPTRQSLPASRRYRLPRYPRSILNHVAGRK